VADLLLPFTPPDDVPLLLLLLLLPVRPDPLPKAAVGFLRASLEVGAERLLVGVSPGLAALFVDPRFEELLSVRPWEAERGCRGTVGPRIAGDGSFLGARPKLELLPALDPRSIYNCTICDTIRADENTNYDHS